MEGNNKKASTKAPELEVNHETVLGAQYAQVVTVTVTDLEATFEFIYVNPVSKKGIAVSRITMAAHAAEEFAKLVSNTIEQHREKNKEKK